MLFQVSGFRFQVWREVGFLASNLKNPQTKMSGEATLGISVPADLFLEMDRNEMHLKWKLQAGKNTKRSVNWLEVIISSHVI